MLAMRYVDVAGESISAVGLGTWQFGSKEWGYGDEYARDEAARIVARALDLGVNLFDSAEMYGGGLSEEILGRALDGERERAFITTKFFPLLPIPGAVERHGRRSAARLGVEQVDLYLLHWPHPPVPAASTMRGMRRLQQAGVTRRVGVSNHSLRRWQRAERALGGPVFANQVQFSLVRRSPRHDLVPFAAANDRLVMAYSPLAQGYLSGAYHAGRRPTGMRARNPVNPLSSPHNLKQSEALLDTLRDVGARHAATPSQVALAWVIAHPNTVVIPGARTVEQMEQNAAAADLHLDTGEMARLTEMAERLRLRGGLARVADALRAGTR